MALATVATLPPGGEWTVLGRGHHHPGHPPRGQTWSWNQWGPDTGGFTVTGRPDRPDLALGAQVRVTSSAGVVFGGRVKSVTPDGRDLQVACEGHQYALDDDVWRKAWVRDRLDGFIDIRSGPAGAALNTGIFNPDAGFQVEAGGTLLLTIPAGGRLTNETVQAIVDLGQADAKEVAITWDGPNGGHANVQLIVQGYDDPACTTGGVNLTGTPAATSALTPDSTHVGTFTTAKRYLGIGLQATTAFTLSAPVSIRILRVKVTPDTALIDASGASALTASDVLDDVAAALAWLNPDASRRVATSTVIPHLTTEDAYETHRTTLGRANAWHDWVMMVDQYARLVHRPRPARATMALGAWSGRGSFQDSGRDLGEAVNRVIVSGTDASGTMVQTAATATSSPLTSAGITKTRVLDIGAALTSSDAAALGAVWLARMSTQPTRGAGNTSGQGGFRDVATGAVVPPAVVMTRVGEIVRLGGETNPDTGGVGRDAVHQGATWTPDTDTVTVTFDAPTDHLDALATRFAAFQSAMPALTR